MSAAAGAPAGAPSSAAEQPGTAMAARVVGAEKVYGAGSAAVRALDGVTVGFPAGRFTAIMGPSGSGKSTLMHCAAGLDSLTAGRAYIGGTELGPLGDRQLTLLRRERIGFVFQSFNLVPTLTVAENITLPLDLAGRRPDAEWVDALVDVVGLGGRLAHRPSELSGGQQQRVAVARALAGRPEVVFADEPTGNLDSRSGGEVLGLLGRAVHEMGGTVVMVTHDPNAAAHADEVVFLADGRLVDRMADPTASRVLDRMKAFDTRTGQALTGQARTDRTRTDRTRAERARPDHAGTDPARTDSARTDPARTDRTPSDRARPQHARPAGAQAGTQEDAPA
ncbi:putative ABC transport system ATP-binding protein [Actinacidiphila guanduensis]|uniref:Putative ABC transport system ATP-binding protein n=1 Tax=Actinacidiphila guanduensis TaxID=310781 RepID=A0A1H0I1W8_9ACTN|nr:putative ABC transport system ATP-binding protein [Actinacidiphila guanduensis]